MVLSLAAWRAVVHALAATHTVSAPPGLAERIRALLGQAPPGWSEQEFALEFDDSSAEAVHAIEQRLAGGNPAGGQRAASVAEAMQIIHDHHQHR
jgi:hypothetical protein